MNANERKYAFRVHLRLFAAVLFLAVSFYGCSRHAGRGGSANTLREPMTLEPATFDPARVNEGGTGGMLQNIFEGLVDFDTDNRIIPVLAEKWDVSADGRSYTFQLRANA